MAFIDILLGGLLLYGLIRGIWNGFFVELASFVSLVIGIFAAIKFSYLAKEIIRPHVSWNPVAIQVVAFGLTFILVVVGISLLAKVFTRVATFAGLGIFNKLLGGIFGLIKMVLILSISLNLFAKINFSHSFATPETLSNSIFYNPVRKIAASIYPAIENWYGK